MLFQGRRDDAEEYDGDVFEKIERATEWEDRQGLLFDERQGDWYNNGWWHGEDMLGVQLPVASAGGPEQHLTEHAGELAEPDSRTQEKTRWEKLLDAILLDEVAEAENLGDMGVYDPELLMRLFELHKRVRSYARMLERIREFMDGWIGMHMPVTRGSQLEDYITAIGRGNAPDGKAHLAEPDLERGKRIIRRAWWAFRDDVTYAIKMANCPRLVHIRKIGWFAGGLNMPGLPGYTLDREILERGFPQTVLELMIHEPMHDARRHFLGHSDFWTWKKVDKTIGWNVQGDWREGVRRLVSYIFHVMRLWPLATGPGGKGPKSHWESALRESGLQED